MEAQSLQPRSVTLTVSQVQFSDGQLTKDAYAIFLCKDQIVCTANANSIMPQTIKFDTENNEKLTIRLYTSENSEPMEAQTVSLQNANNKEKKMRWVHFYTKEKKAKKDDTLEQGESESTSVPMASFEYQFSTPPTSAQGTRQRLRFCDGVSEETLLSLSRTERSRQEAIFEFISTEQNYVQDISVIVNEFVIPLQKQEILSKEDIYNICINLDIILPINQKFLKDLLKRQSVSFIVDDISDIILKHQPKLEVYIEYCSKHSFALRRVSEYAEKYEKFREFLAVPKPAMKETLQGYLVKPFQRLTRYTMLVQSIMKNTLPGPAKLNLTIAWESFKRMATRANSQLRQEEERVKAVEVWNLLQKSTCADALLQSASLRFFQKSLDNKSLVSENNPMSLALFYGRAMFTKNSTAAIDGYIFLFNDCLFITKGKDIKSLVPVQRIPIQDITIISLHTPLVPLELNRRLSILHTGKKQLSISHSEFDLLLQENAKYIEQVKLIQAFWRMIRYRRELVSQKHNEEKLREAFVWIKQREEDYLTKISSLEGIIDPLMNNDDLRCLFCDLTDIPTIHQSTASLVNTLNLLLAQDDFLSSSSITALVNIWHSLLEPYRNYVTIYSQITSDISSLSQDRPDLIELVKKTEKSRAVTPGSHVELLEQPSFHMANYLKASEKILAYLPSSHNEYKRLTSIREAFSKLNGYCESLRKHARNMNRLTSVQARLTQFEGLEEEGRTFIREGSLHLIPEDEEKTIFMFNDILIISESKTNKIRNVVQLDEVSLIDLNATHFQLLDKSHRSFIFKAARNIHKRRWVKELTEAIEVLQVNREENSKNLPSVRAKRSSSVFVDDTKKWIVLSCGSDVWSFNFTESPKHNAEFSDQIRTGIHNIFREALLSAIKRNNEEDPFTEKLKIAKNSLSEEQRRGLVPLLDLIHSITKTTESINKASEVNIAFRKQQLEKNSLRFRFLAGKILQQPKLLSHVPPKPPSNTGAPRSTPKTKKWIQREKSSPNGSASRSANPTNSSSMDKIFNEDGSSSSKGEKGYVGEKLKHINGKMQTFDADVKQQGIRLDNNDRIISSLESENKILTETVAQQAEKLKKLEAANEQILLALEQQQKASEDIRNTLETYISDREKRRKEAKEKRRAKRKKKVAGDKSRSDIDSSEVSHSVDVSDMIEGLPVDTSTMTETQMPDIFSESELMNSTADVTPIQSNGSVNSINTDKNSSKSKKATKKSPNRSKTKKTPQKQRSRKTFQRVASDHGKSSLDEVSGSILPAPSPRVSAKQPRKRSKAKVETDQIKD